MEKMYFVVTVSNPTSPQQPPRVFVTDDESTLTSVVKKIPGAFIQVHGAPDLSSVLKSSGVCE